ncbi:DUF2167 domain-containing protein [Chitinophaga barathri]|uniref:DUF2167 domain-containing protein n=1 Tax=Chitinophaga barathri TaxID=1647451 RepID=A0A3N4MHV2_9BACT|nr:DUF2167 domain-containing protein [Chitinophaga barathri]RPD41626.1 DUF2167 domain-containing protein [Chitinophaga barathri]
MKKTIRLMVCALAVCLTAHAQLDTSGPRATEEEPEQELSEAEYLAMAKVYTDSVNATFSYKTGIIKLGSGAVLNVPKGFRYLDEKQSHRVLEDLWGNPKAATLGLLVPDSLGPMSPGCWVFDISFEEIGYVKDEDADKIDYNDLLKELKKETLEGNAEREKQGYDPIEFIGWASTPYYDKDKKTLHWARELKFGDNEDHTLNYNVRILGRKGVLFMNAIGNMENLEAIRQNIPAILAATTFEKGDAYADFDPGVDEVAAWTIGGLVAGKVLAKAGLFALVLKFGKFIVLGLIAGGAALWRWITGRRRKNELEDGWVMPAPKKEGPSEPETAALPEAGEDRKDGGSTSS